nr:MAG TPA: hypothetical protein [Caudoviricetes sp.]
MRVSTIPRFMTSLVSHSIKIQLRPTDRATNANRL